MIEDGNLRLRSNLEYVNALWIEWVDNIVSRKGVGKMLKEKCEAHALEGN